MGTLQYLLIFIGSLGLLILASKYFTEAAERIGLSLKLSPFMVGEVIVAVGTSLPELVSGIIASTAATRKSYSAMFWERTFPIFS